MPEVELDGLEVAYNVVGDGRPWIITPGGRFHKEFGGIPEMAQALAGHGQKVITWDRPNCGASSVVFGDGRSRRSRRRRRVICCGSSTSGRR